MKKKTQNCSKLIPKRNFRWVTPVKSKDFREIVAKGRKQGIQAQIWMQKSDVCAQVFSNQIKNKTNHTQITQKIQQTTKQNIHTTKLTKINKSHKKYKIHRPPPTTSIPKRNFRWVTPMKSKDFSEIVAKGRKQRFQAKIWMQKSDVCACPVFFQIIFRSK